MAGAALLPNVAGGTAPASRGFTITARPGRAPLVGNGYPDTDVWAYNGTVPGPEIRVRQGERVRINVKNELAEATTVHWHGVRVPNAMDGVPHLTQKPIAPGETFLYEFDVPDAGTYWYHPRGPGGVRRPMKPKSRTRTKRAGIVAAALGLTAASFPAAAEEAARMATMYKPLQCNCCNIYARYLESHGFKLKIESLPDQRLDAIKRQVAVPRAFEGCHTLMVDGYIVEGLVPIGPLNKLLTERPNVKGISLPGMPVGAPGMPGRKNGPLIIYELPRGPAAPKEYARE